MQLIVGLANPGKKYADTRHNAGAWFIDLIAKRHQCVLKPQIKFHGLYAQLAPHVHLLVPTTFMNLSGQAVQACMNFYKISPEAVLVAHDEIDLPVGVVKLKFDGGDGGHNGLKDVIRHLNSRRFYRLRIGVGHPRNPTPSHSKESYMEVVDYVLDQPSKADRQKINLGLERAEEILPLIIADEMQKAMQALHR